MSRLPWISIVVAALLALNPLGRDAFYLAFQSGEALSRNIWRSIYLLCAAILVAAILIEWYVRGRVSPRGGPQLKETEN